ncbi:MAG: hypothetical protein AAFQ80_07135 [Cyanobacteria bacterium J06621_8]
MTRLDGNLDISRIYVAVVLLEERSHFKSKTLQQFLALVQSKMKIQIQGFSTIGHSC